MDTSAQLAQNFEINIRMCLLLRCWRRSLKTTLQCACCCGAGAEVWKRHYNVPAAAALVQSFEKDTW